MNKYIALRMTKSTLIHAGLIIVAITCLFPLFWMIRCALMTNATIFTDKALIPAQIHFQNFYIAWTQGHFGRYFFNSFIYTGSVVAGIVVVSSLAAFAFSRLQFPGKNFFFYMFVAALMIPLPGSFVPLYRLMVKLGLINTMHGYVFCMINVGLSLSIFLLKTFFDKMSPDLEYAARIDGCSKLGIWWHVALPLARPAIAVIVIFNSLNVWNEYILASLLLNERSLMPLQVGLLNFSNVNNVNYPLLMAGLTIAAAPVIVICLFMQRYIIKGFSGAAVGQEKRFVPPKNKIAVIVVVVAFSILSRVAVVAAQEAQAPTDSVEGIVNQEIAIPEQLQNPEGATPSSEYVRNAWEFSGQGKLQELTDLTKECLSVYKEAAQKMQTRLTELPPPAKTKEYQILNDVATVLFIEAEAYMNYGKTEKGIELFQNIIDTYPFAQAWDPRGWFWAVAEKSQDSIDVMQGKVEEPDEEEVTAGYLTLPQLHTPGKSKFVNYSHYGEFVDVGTKNYRYQMNDPKGLSDAVGEGIYPNTGAILKNPGYKKARNEGRLSGSHWDFVHSDDLEAAFYKWATAAEPWGIKLFYLGIVFEKAEMYYEAIKAYQSIVVHFPKSIGWTYWQTPWYPAQAAIAKIKHIIRTHPDLNLKAKWMKIQIKKGFDNNVNNDEIITYPGVVEQKTFMDMVKERLNLERKGEPLDREVKRVGSGKVQLVQYENGHWQMLVEGEPYIIKGITYAPTKIGQSPDKGTLVSWMHEDVNKNGLADGPYDAWVDANSNNEQDADEPIVGDFQLMKDMGVNTIREYHQPFKPNKELLRKMYKEYGMRVILGDFLGKYTLGSKADWYEGTDYENPEHQVNMMESVRSMVMEFKDEPYILLWLLGNENNYGVASNADKKPEAYFKFANEVAKMIKSIDPDHPVAVCNGDTLYLDVFAENAPDIDIFSANVYRGDYGFGSYWEQVFDASGKPAFITEYGCPAYAKHLTKEEADEAQANYHRGNWVDIELNTAGYVDGAGNALGGVVFEWTDEWWKNYEPFYHDRKSDAIGPFPGGYYFEEWFGITTQGDGTKSPFLRQLRKSYYVYKELWN